MLLIVQIRKELTNRILTIQTNVIEQLFSIQNLGAISNIADTRF